MRFLLIMEAVLGLLLAHHSGLATAWNTEQLDLFDLVEEVNQNFYEFLGISQDASTSEVRKAYKSKALQLHPDKNDAPDAEIRFRQLAAIYEVLKDKTTREMYDQVLIDGLPDWRMPAYYFRRMRKIGLAEGLAYLLAISTVIHYCMIWAAYYERKFTISENMSAELKRKQKRLKKTGQSEEFANELAKEEENLIGPKPTLFDTLPFQLLRFAKFIVFGIPKIPGAIHGLYLEKKRLEEEKAREEAEYEEERKRLEEEKVRRKEAKANKRKNVYSQFKEATEDSCLLVSPDAEEKTDGKPPPRNARQIWTDNDLATLARLIKKYPGGTPDRWERIAELMERYAWEVTKMAGIIKNKPGMVPISTAAQGVTGRESDRLVSDEVLEGNDEEDEMDDEDDSQEEDETETEDEVDEDGYVVYSPQKVEEYIPVEKKKQKTRGGKSGGGEGDTAEDGEASGAQDNWSQEQQKALEAALLQFPKGTSERWERIASKVGGKSKDQCINRFKHLAEMVKKKKEASS